MSGGPAHTLVRASAGTGKTYRLVEAYVRAVCDGLRPGAIVAITFTRKAAQELRGRIRERLGAEGLPQEVLAELAAAPINNFHGLALELLANAGVAGGIGEETIVLGEQGEDRRLFIQACEESWLVDDSAVADAVAELAQAFSVDRDLPGTLWDALARAREDGRAIAGAVLVGTYEQGAVRRMLGPRLEALRARLAGAMATQTATGREKLARCLALAPPPESPLSDPEWAEAWRRAAAQLDRRGGLREIIDKETLELIKGGLVELVVAEATCAQSAPPLARLIDAAWARYGELKRERSAVDFGDLVERAVYLLENDRAIHERIRARYRAVLVDEAQDTNRVQRRFVHLLAGLGGPAAGASPVAGLVVVGDRKQAIYAFRGADPESFTLFSEDLRKLGGSEQTLEESWRSAPAICEGVNHLGRRLFGEGYEPIRAAVPADRRWTRAPTGMRWIETPAATTSAAAVLAEVGAIVAFVTARLDDGEEPGAIALLLSAMANASLYAAALADAGVPLTLGGGGGLYAQPEVLDAAALLAWATDRHSRLAAAVALRSPIFGLSEGALLHLFGAGASDGFDRLVDGARDWPELARDSDREALVQAATVMPRLWRAATLLPPQDLLRYADELLDLEALLAALPSGPQRLGNFRRLVEVAEAFAARESSDARRFARELASRIDGGDREPLGTATEATEAAGGAVSIGTVHQAKGLEFPLVMLADLGHGSRGEQGSVRYARSVGLAMRPRYRGEGVAGVRWREAAAETTKTAEVELARLLYVAVTRGEREVVFFAPAASKSRRGFLKLLGPWRDEAVRDGVLRVEPSTTARGDAAPAPSAPVQATEAELRRAEEFVVRVAVAPVPDGSRFSLAVTDLEAYLQCLRRGALRTQIGLAEPGRPWMRPAHRESDPPLDALVRGRLAHAVLARLDEATAFADPRRFVEATLDSLGYDADDPRLGDVVADVSVFLTTPFGRRLAALAPERRRHELPFAYGVDASPHTMTVNGQMDLLYWDDEGPVVLDFKHAAMKDQAVASYRLQLEAYAVAAAKLCQVEGPVRTQLVFLKERGGIVSHLVTEPMRRDLVGRIGEVARQLASAQRSGELWPGQPEGVCRELECGFRERCHP